MKFEGAILNKERGDQIECQKLVRNPKYKQTWSHSYSNEIGWLVQGMPGRVDGTNTMCCINKTNDFQEKQRDVTYGRIAYDYCKGKAKPSRMRLTMGETTSITLMTVAHHTY